MLDVISAALTWSNIVGKGECFCAHAAEEAVHDFAQSALDDAADVFVDRHDAIDVDGGAIVIAQNLKLGMIDDEFALLVFDFSVNDDLVAGGEHFGEEGHIEPTQGDFVRSKYPAFAIEDDCFIGGEAAGVAHRTGIDDHTTQA